MKKIQIMYHYQATALLEEMAAMRKVGFLVGTEVLAEADAIIYRGPTMWYPEEYPQMSKGIQGWREYSGTLFMSNYYPYIHDITIPTFFSQNLNKYVINEINRRGWHEAFIKNDVSALICKGKVMSIWPQFSMDSIEKGFSQLPQTNTYAIRKRIELSLYQEERYWILNNHAYHHSRIIPDVVNQAIELLKPIGSNYYVIDATPQVIIEVNPGESSDRYIENHPLLFAEWFKDAFL